MSKSDLSFKTLKEHLLSLEKTFYETVEMTDISFINDFSVLVKAYGKLEHSFSSDEKELRLKVKSLIIASLKRLKLVYLKNERCPSQCVALINLQIREFTEQLVAKKYFETLFKTKFYSLIGNMDRDDYAPCFVTYDRKSFLELDKTIDRYRLHCEELDKSVVEMLNTIAYIYGEPNFVLTKNVYLNDQLESLYSNFSITEMLKIRSKSYFTKKPIYLGNFLNHPKMAFFEKSKILVMNQLNHPEMLDLYHSSLKQFEPLPRCVLLYRVVEYGFSIYKSFFRPSDFEEAVAIDYFWQEAKKFRYLAFKYKKYVNGKEKWFDFVKKLKTEADLIISDWMKQSYLKNKTIGEIVYLTGRNFSAHGGNGDRNARYDYSNNYRHINNVNIVLELICRYLIENYNPTIRTLFVN